MARADAGLTISQLAEKAGVSRDTISKAEKGQHNLQAGTLSKVARALGTTASELLAEEEGHIPKALARPSETRAAQSPGVRDEAVQDMVLDAMKRQRVKEGQAFNRAGESRSAQAISMDPENEVFAHLLELPKGAVEDAFLALAKKHLLLQDENTALQDENTALREAAREHA